MICQRFSRIFKDSQRFSRIFKDSQGFSNICQGLPKILKREPKIHSQGLSTTVWVLGAVPSAALADPAMASVGMPAAPLS